MRKFAIWLVAFITLGAHASPFGDTAYVDLFTSVGCETGTPVSIPVSVATTSRVYISARTSYSINDTNLELAQVYAVLRDSADTTTLASSEFAWSTSIGTENFAFVQSDGVLHAGANYNETSPVTYVAAPGTYLLKMQVFASNGTCTGSPQFNHSTLTYLLLSSAFDRIFSDGFEAMLDNGSENSRRSV